MTKRNKKPAPLTQDMIDHINRRIDANEATTAERNALIKNVPVRHEYRCDTCNATRIDINVYAETVCTCGGCSGTMRPTGLITDSDSGIPHLPRKAGA